MAVLRNYTIERGIQFARNVTVTHSGAPVDLTGVEILGQIRLSQRPTDIRRYPTGTGPLATSFDFAFISDNPASGKFTMELTVTNSATLLRADYDYDVILNFPSGEKRRILRGVLTVVQPVSL